MLINILNILTEAALYLLFFGITFSNSATEIFAISIVGFFIIKKTVLRQFKPPKTPINLILYVICAIVFITFLRSAYFSESIRGFLRVIKFIFLFFALTEFFTEDEKRIKRTFRVIMAVACFTFLNGIFQSISGFDLLRHHGFTKDDYLRRILASFVHPNDFGAYIIVIIPLTFCFFSSGLKKNQRIFLIMNCLLGCYCLLKTSSRAAWLGFLVGVIIYFFIYKRKISMAVPLAIVLFVAFTPHGFDRMISLFAAEHNTVWERTQLWKGTWNMVKVHPFLGFGINTFSRYFLEYKPAEYPDIRYTHNSYLQMWSEIGILGLSAYLALIFTVLFKSLHGMRDKIKTGLEGFILLGAVSGYIAFLVQSGLDTNLYSLVLTTLFWVMTAYIISLSKILEKKV
jgi:putative inorganic carbon (hco3(-)) transporter